MAVDAQPSRANGLKTAWDTIIAPKDAFESIRNVPTWGWALALTIVLSVIGNILLVPALQHAMAAAWPQTVAASPQLSQMSPDRQQSALEMTQKFAGFAWVGSFISAPVYALIAAVVLLIFDKLGRGEGTFGRYFAAACNIGLVGLGLGSLVLGIIATLRGAATFNSQLSVQEAMPSLGTIIPATGKLAVFLATVTPFNLWVVGLAVLALLVIGRVPKLQAWLGGIVLFLIPALFAIAFVK